MVNKKDEYPKMEEKVKEDETDGWNEFVTRLEEIIEKTNPKIILNKLVSVISKFEKENDNSTIDGDLACLGLAEKHIESSQMFLAKAISRLEDMTVCVKDSDKSLNRITQEEVNNFIIDMKRDASDMHDQLELFLRTIKCMQEIYIIEQNENLEKLV